MSVNKVYFWITFYLNIILFQVPLYTTYYLKEHLEQDDITTKNHNYDRFALDLTKCWCNNKQSFF